MRVATLALLALAASVPGFAAAQTTKGGTATAPPVQPAYRSAEAAAVAALPPEIGGFRRNEGISDYEARPNGRGLGASINYGVGNGSPFATVYLYDRNRPNLPGGVTSPAVEEELGITRRDIEGAADGRGYRVASVQRMPDVAGPSGAPAFRCDAYVLEYPAEGTRTESFACVGIARSRFVKVRLSYRPHAPTVQAGTLPPDFMRGVAAATGFDAPSGNFPGGANVKS